MTRETRINLIVLGIILVLGIPPATKLFNKMLERGKYAGLSAPPGAARTSFSYLDPMAPPGHMRTVPARTAAWVASLVQANTDASSIASHRWQRTAEVASSTQQHLGPSGEALITSRGPVISERRDVQLAAVTAEEDTLRLGLIVWNRRALPRREAFSILVDTAAGPAKAAVTFAERLDVPSEVVTELKTFGYILPPPTALWLSAEVPGVTPPEVTGLTLEYDDGEQTKFIDRMSITDLR